MPTSAHNCTTIGPEVLQTFTDLLTAQSSLCRDARRWDNGLPNCGDSTEKQLKKLKQKVAYLLPLLLHILSKGLQSPEHPGAVQNVSTSFYLPCLQCEPVPNNTSMGSDTVVIQQRNN